MGREKGLGLITWGGVDLEENSPGFCLTGQSGRDMDSL